MPERRAPYAERNLKRMVETMERIPGQDVGHLHAFLVGYFCGCTPEEQWDDALHYSVNMLQKLHAFDKQGG